MLCRQHHWSCPTSNDGAPCRGALEVFDWLATKVNDRNGCMIVAYGDLIHLHREKDFVNPTTKEFFDDDIDAWTSLETVSSIAHLEPQLFETFGWTVRLIVTNAEEVRPWGYPLLRKSYVIGKEYAVLAQAFAVCGHDVETDRSRKVNSTEPTIDLYPIVTIREEEEISTDGGIVASLRGFLSQRMKNPEKDLKKEAAAEATTRVKDLWQGNQFSESILFPRKLAGFVTAGLAASHSSPLPLQLPRRPLRVLECLYGNWTVPSGNHSESSLACTD